MKDGNYQLVREYQVQGDRIRYYSLDSGQWEEMPAALVDWDATHKLEAEEARRDADVIAKAHAAETARKAEMPIDVDASLEAAPGVFLPPGEGLFVYDGKAVLPLSQALADSKLSKAACSSKCSCPSPWFHPATIFRSPARGRNFGSATRSPSFTCAQPTRASRTWVWSG